ncbi:MAG TPA: molybdenum cofactor biosynthesis protein MoaE [Thermoplasmata archaeon]|nr:molybdenum cofactor biosynthesis protein MoaE [Thermoplasmata archaeon]
MPRIRVDRRPISIGAAYRELDDPESGGVVLFLGRVRPDPGRGGRVAALDYEADVPMAVRSLAELAERARRRFGARRLVIYHRLGRLPVGTVSVLVGAAAPHRRSAFGAARYLIERLKVEVPIWKMDRVRRGRRPRRRPPTPGGR